MLTHVSRSHLPPFLLSRFLSILLFSHFCFSFFFLSLSTRPATLSASSVAPALGGHSTQRTDSATSCRSLLPTSPRAPARAQGRVPNAAPLPRRCDRRQVAACVLRAPSDTTRRQASAAYRCSFSRVRSIKFGAASLVYSAPRRGAISPHPPTLAGPLGRMWSLFGGWHRFPTAPLVYYLFVSFTRLEVNAARSYLSRDWRARSALRGVAPTMPPGTRC